MELKKEPRRKDEPAIHVLGRAVIISEGHILLAHQINAKNTFLPGGHVEYNEGTKKAIVRELKEEFNGEARVDEFIGIIEHSFEDRYENKPFYELSLLFKVKLLSIRFPDNPESNEPHLEFRWHPLEKLGDANLLPEPLNAIIFDYSKAGKKSLWISTLERGARPASETTT